MRSYRAQEPLEAWMTKMAHGFHEMNQSFPLPLPRQDPRTIFPLTNHAPRHSRYTNCLQNSANPSLTADDDDYYYYYYYYCTLEHLRIDGAEPPLPVPTLHHKARKYGASPWLCPLSSSIVHRPCQAPKLDGQSVQSTTVPYCHDSHDPPRFKLLSGFHVEDEDVHVISRLETIHPSKFVLEIVSMPIRIGHSNMDIRRPRMDHESC